jgi:ABC-type multidrug transport system ATPase subunit
MILIKDLWKRLGKRWVLVNVNLMVKGTYLLTGPNGSGKTTLVRLIAGLLEPSRGIVEVDGGSRNLGIVLHNPLLYPDLTVRENLELYGELYGVDYRDKLDLLGISRYMDVPVRELSFGWRRRVDVVRAIIHEPRNLVLDEPLTGLDDEARDSLISLLNDYGGSLLITSSNPCDRAWLGLSIESRGALLNGSIKEVHGNPEEGC